MSITAVISVCRSVYDSHLNVNATTNLYVAAEQNNVCVRV